MSSTTKSLKNLNDPTAVSRKRDHIELAFKSQIDEGLLDKRFYYEPLLSAHPEFQSSYSQDFLGKKIQTPMWVSSMTGGTEMAFRINHNLAKACKAFGMGMGLGSCRSLLRGNERLKDFDVRHLIGDDLPLFANLGIAQLEEVIDDNEWHLVDKMIDQLRADGLIIHVNPMQEWLQPEGDRFRRAPLTTIKTVLEKASYPIIVKEVGQGMGYESLKQLFQLPLAAIDFAANGGTNFSKLELLRSSPEQQELYKKLTLIGHSASEMVEFTNQLAKELGDKMRCKQVIISGGVKDFLDGYYLTNKLTLPSVYGQASGFLKHARGDYETLADYIKTQIKGFQLAKAYLRVR